MMYRRYRVPSMWREMDRLFEDYSPRQVRSAPSYPALNVWSNEEGLLVTAEVPGVSPEDIEVNVIGETLVLSGVRKPEDLPAGLKEGARYHRQERGYGKFSRTLQLPFPVSVPNIEATFKHGVLNVSLPRAEEDKPRKIAVKSA